MADASYIRINKSVVVEGSSTNGNAIRYIEGACTAAAESELPTEGVAMGSKMYVVDEGAYIYYNEAEEKWVDASGGDLS